jgi:hypothetical protein
MSPAQELNKKSNTTLEQGKITVKVKEGIGPIQEQSGNISFGVISLDQKTVKYEVYRLSKRFIHKPIPKNSGLPDLSRIYQIEFPTKFNPVIVALEFSLDPNVEYAEPIPINYLLEVPNDPLYNQQWYLHKIQSELTWDIHKGEDGDSVIILSITDTGCKYDHQDIGSNIWNNLGEDFDGDGKTFEWNGTTWVFDTGDLNNVDDDGNGFIDDLIGWNFDNNNSYPTDGNGHGTAVSGIAGATTNNDLGVASISYNLQVMSVRAFNPQGTGTNTNAYNSLIYSAENGADIINCSWGGWPYSEANKEVVEYVDGLGSLIVAAAGNDNTSNPLYPASYPYVISVAALDSQNVKTPYSTYGPGVDVSAPGPQDIQPFITLNTAGTYGNVTLGTSFSTPIVTGLLGLIKSYHPTWTRDQLVMQLLYTTDDINSLNPGFEYFLGTGEINAYHALADSEITIAPELKINMNMLSSTITSESKTLYSDSSMTFSFRVQNCSHFLDANPLTITLTSNNPDVQIIDGEFSGTIAANSVTELIDEFQVQVAPNAETAIATLTFTASANLPVVAGSIFEIHLIVNPSGALVWEGVENGQDYSGEYIKNYLSSHSYSVLYTTLPILSYIGLDALFLSFGNYGSSGTTNTFFDDYHAAQVEDYLIQGGKVYLEGGDALGWDQSGNAYLHFLLGIQSPDDGSTNIINSLEGQNTALTQGMLFTSSTQFNNQWIDIYTPNANGTVSFIESEYGNVAVQSTGTYGQRAFCFSYALSELVDENLPSTKDTLIQRILDFFELEPLPLPSAPLLFKPQNNTTLDSSSTLFVWRKSQPQVTKYWFELDTTEQFITSIIDSTVSDTSFFFEGLHNNKSYWWRVRAYNTVGWGNFSELWKFATNIVSVKKENIPVEFSVQQNYPNPFNPKTTIKYGITERTFVELRIYDILGREVEVMINQEQEAGYYEKDFNAENLPSGVYIYRLQAGDFIQTKKMMLMK